MSHVSSITSSSYPYRGTLSRLDSNGDGVLSQEERQADERPGILETDAVADGDDDTNNALGSLMAKLMQLPTAGSTSKKPADASNSDNIDLLTPMAAYNSTYGQYDIDSMAA